jgi:uncharacterized SAM-binding protein YcdF (DUF218 family)
MILLNIIKKFLKNNINKFLLFIVSFIFLFFFIGLFLDIGENPKKSNYIISLGGDIEFKRINKAIELYKNGYSSSNKIILTGYNEESKYRNIEIKRKSYLLSIGIEEKNIILFFNTKNTFNELKSIKEFILKEKVSNIIIISDPPHTKRISILCEILEFNKSNINYNIVSSDVSWWNKKFLLFNYKAYIFIAKETSKIVHNYFKYFLINRIGLSI